MCVDMLWLACVDMAGVHVCVGMSCYNWYVLTWLVCVLTCHGWYVLTWLVYVLTCYGWHVLTWLVYVCVLACHVIAGMC